MVEVPEAQAERCGSRDGVDDSTAQRCAELAVDEAVEERELDLESERNLDLHRALRVLDCDVGGRAEDLALAAGFGLLLGGVVDLLEHARHGRAGTSA